MIEAARELANKMVSSKYRGKKNFTDKGRSALFAPLDDKWGVKLYAYKSERDGARERQHNASEFGLAPEAGESFDIDRSDNDYGHYRYGYITQLAEPINKDDRDEIYSSPDYQELVDGLNSLDIYGEVSYWKNVAKLNGKLVAIDFGA